MRDVLLLGPESAPEMERVLCDAFAEYPVMRYVLFEERPGYASRLRALVRLSVMGRVHRGEHMLGIGDSAELLGAAGISRSPVADAPAAFQAIRTDVWDELGDEVRARYEQYTAAWQPFLPSEPHLHINMIGVVRTAQGTGLASPLMHRVHEISLQDPNSCGVSLTTENPRNVSFYQHFGYEIVGEAAITPGLTTWGFFRPDQRTQ